MSSREWSSTELDAFVAGYSKALQTDDDAPAPDVRAAALAHLEFAAVRAAGEILVRVITPQTAEWQSRRTHVQIAMPDMPFIVDSLTALLSRNGRSVHRLFHPIYFVERDADGAIQYLSGDSEERGKPESWAAFEIGRLLTESAHTDLRDEILQVLRDVQAATSDWRFMREKALDLAELWANQPPACVEHDDATETAQLLDWLGDNHMTFIGYRHYRLEQDSLELIAEPNSGLGILRHRPASVRKLSEIPAAARDQVLSRNPLVLTKSSHRSTVHRPVYMDYIGVKQFDADGKVIGEHRFLGLLSREAYSDSILSIPVMRRHAAAVLESSGWLEGSHSYRDLLQLLETFPRDEMLQVDTTWLTTTALAAVHNQGRRDAQVYVHADAWGRFVSVFVFLARDTYNTNVRQAIEAVLSRHFGAVEIDSSVSLGESSLARILFRVHSHGMVAPDASATAALVAEIKQEAHSWNDEFIDAVIAASDNDERASETVAMWAAAFNEGYRAEYTVAIAVDDIHCIGDGTSRSVRLLQRGDSRFVRIFEPGRSIKLSALLPLLSAFGLDVVDEQPYMLSPQGLPPLWLHDLGFTLPAVAADGWEERFTEALLQVMGDEAEVDPLLALVVAAPMSSREVAVLRAYAGYVSQWTPYSLDTVHEALTANPAVAVLLMQSFASRFDGPAASGDGGQLDEALDAVASLDHDRILRAIAAAMDATVRTNAYQHDAQGNLRRTVAIKVLPQSIAAMPEPKPFAEIWVESPSVRGVHLRFGPVARGGLRWSDRRSDMRTEILGLVRAQVVKNAVIVPTGAKGGFFAKQLPAPSDRDAFMKSGIAAYREYINALLDVTDNRVGDEVVPPAETVRYDGDDPYLVVAADKGTATFSDIANEVAMSRGFWLGDAFASGGSVGYDHKAMGITARGAWESVKHHAALLGLDPQTQPMTVVGIGDMSGDVFGNGMLLSSSMLVVAAFDHRHIFIDPNPRAQESFDERKRLFELPRSSWDDFDRSVISAGGGVYPRTDKSIPLSAAAAARLGLGDAEIHLTPNEVMTAILRAPVDLLWNGGIGTYIKSSGESNADVGDKANDAIRINGAELRCRIVGEGGNLGVTQLGRVEAALAGVALNSDAIDNSAGVDTSDHEVNLKILFSLAPWLAVEDRNRTLAYLTDAVAEQVLADNINNNVVLTVAASQSYDMVEVHRSLIAQWDREGVVHRTLEGLPSDAELDLRAAQGKGLVKPELAVLLAHAKLELSHQLLLGKAIDATWAERWLFAYFPEHLHGEFADAIRQHPLRRNIIATVIANEIINFGGISSVVRLQQETGGSTDACIQAMLMSLETGHIRELIDRCDELELSWDAKIAVHKAVRRYIDRVSRWLVNAGAESLNYGTDLDRFVAASDVVRSHLSVHLCGDEHARWTQDTHYLVSLGLPEAMARVVAGLLDEYAAFDLAQLAQNHHVMLVDWSETYFAVSNEVGGDVLLSSISSLPRADAWQTAARGALRADMYAILATLTAEVLDSGYDTENRLELWRADQAAAISRVRAIIGDIAAMPRIEIAPISVALRGLRALAAQTGGLSERTSD